MILEWDRFVELARTEARSVAAKAAVSTLLNSDGWAKDLSHARLLQQETQDVLPLLDRDALWGPLLDLESPDSALERLGKGSVLELAELVMLRRWIYAVESWIQIPREDLKTERFRRALALLPDPSEALRILDGILTPDGELSERASPKLKTLSAEIHSIKREIEIVLSRLMSEYSARGILQETFSDVRDGRYVLPVKISKQGEIEGIVYEASVSRQTAFVEPTEVARLNNRLSQRKNEYVEEVFRILEGVSRRLAPYGDEIGASAQILTHWDLVQAKARVGRRYSGKTIQVVEERTFSLKQTAHPLLWWTMPVESIIRNDIEFGHPSRALLITGPNTGGKTVLLKTLGLAAICARTGFLFPGETSPTVPFCDSFFVDVGDSQSIEQNVSSFSGHVIRFREILTSLTDQSLVLLDELNSATDPEEGAALGRAVLETLMGRNAMIVSTTHDPYLKALSVTDSRICVASMAFNDSSRVPTFRMVLGVPGRSRALETAERLGIPLEVIALARGYLSKGHLDFEKMLASLEQDLHQAAQARREAVAAREEAERLRQDWTSRSESSLKEMLERVRQKMKRVTEQAQDEVRATVRRLDEMKQRREIDVSRGKVNEIMREAEASLSGVLSEEAPEQAESVVGPPPEVIETVALKTGMSVRIPKWKATGTILEVSGEKIKVAMGTVQMTLDRTQVEVLKNAPSQGSVRMSTSYQAAEPPAEIDLRGIRLDEAMSLLSQYLDQSYRSGSRQEVTVIHGLGTGALREGTLSLLSRLPYVKDYRDGGAGRGGAGATIVEFDR